MGRKRVPGLIMRAGIWHIDKIVLGRRVCQSTGTSQVEDAERTLARVMEEARQAHFFGVRPARTFEQALGRLPHPWFGDRVVWSLSCRSRAT